MWRAGHPSGRLARSAARLQWAVLQVVLWVGLWFGLRELLSEAISQRFVYGCEDILPKVIRRRRCAFQSVFAALNGVLGARTS